MIIWEAKQNRVLKSSKKRIHNEVFKLELKQFEFGAVYTSLGQISLPKIKAETNSNATTAKDYSTAFDPY